MTQCGKILSGKVCYASLLIFSILAIAYFLPGNLLSGFLPDGVVRFRIAYPVAVLFLGGLMAGLDWQFAIAFLFSCTGDAFGAGGSFIGQMGFFALAHVMFIWGFIRGLRVISTGSTDAKERIWIGFGLAAVAAIMILAVARVLPSIEDGVLVWGCGIYALLICTMASLAMLQRSPAFALGALLFAVSDLILSWNLFVGPVAYEKYLVMLPYYLGQFLLWFGAVRKTSSTIKR